jgi:hypothetical protein
VAFTESALLSAQTQQHYCKYSGRSYWECTAVNAPKRRAAGALFIRCNTDDWQLRRSLRRNLLPCCMCYIVMLHVISAAAGEIFDRTKMMRAAPEGETETADMHVSSGTQVQHFLLRRLAAAGFSSRSSGNCKATARMLLSHVQHARHAQTLHAPHRFGFGLQIPGSSCNSQCPCFCCCIVDCMFDCCDVTYYPLCAAGGV